MTPMTDAEIAELRAGLVKPLVWRDLSAPNDPEFLAHHAYGSYTIRFDASCPLPWIVRPFPCAGSNFASLEEAQAAAEAEHKSRMVRELDPAALLARLEAAEGGWQDIATAPKDGTAVVLCWAIDADGKRIDWTESPTTAGVFVQVASWWANDGAGGAWVVYCSRPSEPRLHFEPTHWRPLPKPPAPKAGGCPMARIPRDPAYGKPPRWGKLYDKHFPHNTDGASRHVKCFAEQLRDVRGPVRALIADYQQPDHIARSMEVTVQMLWEARARIAELEVTIAKAEG